MTGSTQPSAPFMLSRQTVAAAVLLVLMGCTRGDARARPAEQAGAVAAVRAALDTSVAAWNRGDLDGHVAVYADSAVFRPSGEARGPIQARRNFVQFFARPTERPRLTLDSLVVSTMGADHVLATGQYVLTGGTVAVPRRGWFTEVWARTPQGWRIILDHSS